MHDKHNQNSGLWSRPPPIKPHLPAGGCYYREQAIPVRSPYVKVYRHAIYQPLSRGVWEHLRYMVMPAFTIGFAQSALLARMNPVDDAGRAVPGLHSHGASQGAGGAVGALPARPAQCHYSPDHHHWAQFCPAPWGAVISEQIFNIPGVGRLLIQGVSTARLSTRARCFVDHCRRLHVCQSPG